MKFMNIIFLYNSFKDFFSTDSRGGLLKLNILTGLVIKGCSMGLSLIFVPLVLSWLGKSSYGIWLTISSMVSWLSFLDIGLSGGLRLKLQESMTNGHDEQSRIYISTTYAILLFIAFGAFVITALFLYIWNPNLSDFFQVRSDYEGNLCIIMYLTLGCFFLRFALQPISTILQADQRNFIQSFILFTESVINLIGIFVFRYLFPGNLVLACVLFSISPILNLLAYTLVLFAKRYRTIKPSYKYIEIGYIRGLMNIGVDVFVINIALVLAGMMNNFIITKFFGSNSVTDYNLVYKIYATVGTLFTLMMTPVWSAFANAYYKNDFTWIDKMLKRLLKYYILFLLLYLVLIPIGPFIVRIWSGVEVNSWDLYIVSSLYYIIQSFMTIYAFLFNGMGEIKIQRNMAVFGALVNIPVAYILIRYFDMGPSAAIIGNIVAIVPSIWLYPIKAKRLLSH